MTCPTCGATNREDAAFCRNCGRLLLATCPRCRSAAGPGANFCDTCGYPLSPHAWIGAWPTLSISLSLGRMASQVLAQLVASASGPMPARARPENPPDQANNQVVADFFDGIDPNRKSGTRLSLEAPRRVC